MHKKSEKYLVLHRVVVGIVGDIHTYGAREHICRFLIDKQMFGKPTIRLLWNLAPRFHLVGGIVLFGFGIGFDTGRFPFFFRKAICDITIEL
jgi:hypothetical protein